MKYNWILFAFCALIAQSHSVRDPKLFNTIPIQREGRIIHGEPAVNGQFPHMTFLPPQPMSVGCGGSLIDDKWVITAAHCVDRINSTFVYLGDVNYKLSPVIVKASKIHIHPAWKRPSLNNDIALLELDEPITFTDNIKPIRLPNSRDNLFVGEISTVSGYGFINDDQELPEVLQHVNLTVITNTECEEYYLEIIESVVCGKAFQKPSQGVCTGDSGSGLILRYPDDEDILIGIASFTGGAGCESHTPSGFTRVNYFLDWIRETTWLDI